MKINKELFGTYQDHDIDLYTVSNEAGTTVSITNYGAIITSLTVPDRDGKATDIVLGFDTLDEYIGNQNYIGSLVGRYANRIKGGTFQLDGVTQQLTCNRPGLSLHGGGEGFNKKIWEASTIEDDRGSGVELRFTSPDGDEGFPGELQVRVCYVLSEGNDLIMEYMAETDQATIVNLTQHSYFNLAGQGEIIDHHLQVNGSRITPVGSDLIPTGEQAPVEGSPFDFRETRLIGKAMQEDDPRKPAGEGFDHNYVLDTQGSLNSAAATLSHQPSGRVMEVYTTKPGMQLYTGNYLTEQMQGRGQKPFIKYGALCLETQYYPDSPNQPSFPSPVLRPGETYHHTTIYRFSTLA